MRSRLCRCGSHHPVGVRCPRRPHLKTYGWEYQQKRAALKATATTCAICGHPFTKLDPMTVDHVVPVAVGGGDGPLRAVHASCNSRLGQKLSQ